MARVIDKDPNSSTFGLLIEQGTPTAKAPYVNAPAPLDKVTDRPVDPLKNVAAGGGAIMVNDKIYTGGLGLDSYSNNKISQGSEGVRGDMNTMINNATNLSTDLNANFAETTAADLKSMLEGLAPKTAETDIQKAEAAAAKAEEAKWAPLISEAQRQKEKGFAQATISVGERGGFMSSQMAGTAALVPTVGQDFSGAGGKLNEIESDYDNNISNLKAKSLQAIQAAKDQARAAIEGNDSKAYERAVELYKLAQDANSQAVELATKKVKLVSTYKEMEQARINFNTDSLDRIASVGGSVPDQLKAEADGLYGEGWTDLYVQAVQKSAAAQDEASQLEAMKDIVDVLKSYPAGKTIPIGGDVYETIGSSSDTQTFKEEDRAGNITFVTVDKRSGEVINKASGGKIGKGVSSSGGGGGSSNNPALESDIQGLLSSRGADGYVNTAKYAELYDKYVTKGSKYVKDFLSRVTPEVYLNPTDSTAKKYLQTQTQVLKGSNGGTMEDELDSLLGD